jgi:hypothetical protein
VTEAPEEAKFAVGPVEVAAAVLKAVEALARMAGCTTEARAVKVVRVIVVPARVAVAAAAVVATTVAEVVAEAAAAITAMVRVAAEEAAGHPTPSQARLVCTVGKAGKMRQTAWSSLAGRDKVSQRERSGLLRA